MAGRPKRSRTVLDWLRVTIPYKYDANNKITDYLSDNNNPMTAYKVNEKSTEDLIYSVINVLSLDGVNYTDASIATLTGLERAMFNYTGTYVIGHARIMYKRARSYMPLSDIKMGICLELSSHALRDIEQSEYFTNWIDFFQNIRKYFPDARFTRIDIASDYFKDMGRLSAEGLHRLLKDKKIDFVTTSRSAPRYQGSIIDKKDTGETVYIQSPASSYMLRVYNKKAERIHSHGDVWLKNNKIKNWVRWEIQYNADSAPQVAHEIINGVDPAWIWHDTINKLMSFQVSGKVVGNNRKHKYVKVKWRSPRSKNVKDVWVPKWWDDFMSEKHIPHFDFSGKTPHWTYDKHMNWIARCVLPTFTKDLIVQIIQGGDVDTYLNHLLDQGMSKLQPKDMDDIVRYARQIRASKFYETDDNFKFMKTVKHISDRMTGMIEARIYDLRNAGKVNTDDLEEIKIREYEIYCKEHGLANNFYNLKGTGVI